MPLSLSTAELIDSLADYNDIVSWINDTLDPPDQDDSPLEQDADLTELEQHITHLVATLDIACEDTSLHLERIIDDISRGVPRLTYDLHFMKDGASTLQAALVRVHSRSADSVPHVTRLALDRLQFLDTVKGRMESAREVLREAESWSTLELEVTSLLTERSYAKAAERLSEASKSMAVFQNTPDYEPRRTLMVSLQNQLEASLSSALVAAINTQDVAVCRDYFSIFVNIQRESEFRNYYNGSRRAPIVTLWHDAHPMDCHNVQPSLPGSASQTFANFLPKFYAGFLSLINVERASIPSIFPDPPLTLSTLIVSVLSTLQPTFSQRLSSLFTHYGSPALKEVISAFKATEEFAASADQIMEKIKYSAVLPSLTEGPSNSTGPQIPIQSHIRRRSTRMSMSWRSGPHQSSSIARLSSSLADRLEWDQELFQPFLDFQVDYGSLEQRLLGDVLKQIASNDTREQIPVSDRARLLRERAVDIFGVAEESVARCISFTHGYGAVGLVQALDSFFQSFIDMWTANFSMESSTSPSSPMNTSALDEDLSDLDYSTQDWADFQLSIHLLASARAVFERMSAFETKLRSNLAHIATQFRLAQNDPTKFSVTASRGQSSLLEQSALNSVELHSLLNSVESDPSYSREGFLPTNGLRHSQPATQSGSAAPLLVDTRTALLAFAKACQVSLQGIILSPLRKHLAAYPSSSLWVASGEPKPRHAGTAVNDLQVPNFSLSPSDIVQRVAEGLLNLPRLFEVYADDDALSFSLHTLPYADAEVPQDPSGQPLPNGEAPSQSHIRRVSLALTKPTPIDTEAVSSAWLSSLGKSLLSHLTTTVLPNISTLTMAGAAQLSSDLSYLSNIVRALNVEFDALEKWREYIDMNEEEGRQKVEMRDSMDLIFQNVARMRSWGS